MNTLTKILATWGAISMVIHLLTVICVYMAHRRIPMLIESEEALDFRADRSDSELLGETNCPLKA